MSSGAAWDGGGTGHSLPMRAAVRSVPAEAVLSDPRPGRLLRAVLAVLLAASAVLLAG